MNQDSLLECLYFSCHAKKQDISRAMLTEGLPIKGNLTPEMLVRSADQAGMRAKRISRKLNDIDSKLLPVIALLENNDACVITHIQPSELGPDSPPTYFCYYPSKGTDVMPLSEDELNAIYAGDLFKLRIKQRFDERLHSVLDDNIEHWFFGTIIRSANIYKDVILATLLINVFAVASPLFVMNVYDRVVPNAAIETLWAMVVGVCVIFIFDFIIKKLRHEFLEVAGKKSDILLSSKIFAKTLSMKMKARPKSIGAFASNLKDFDSIRSFITSTSMIAMADLPFIILFLFVIYYVGGALVIIPLITMPIIIIYGLIAQFAVQRSIEKTYQLSARKNALVIESLSNIETVKCLGAQSHLQHEWEQAVGHTAYWSQKSRMISASTNHFAQLMQQLNMVFIVVLGTYLIADLELTMGALIACVMLSGRIAGPISQFASLLANYQQTKTAFTSLNDIMAQPDESISTKDSHISLTNITGDIHLNNVSFGYPEKTTQALSNVNIKIKAGERIGIIGRVGSGKTSLARLLLGLYEPNQGHVLLDGIDIRQCNLADVRRQISYVDQSSDLFLGTLKQNVSYGLNFVDDQHIISALNTAGLSDMVNSDPQGLDQMIAEKGANLSGGQRQAVAIARAVLRNTSVLVLDEPTSAMDNLSEEAVKANLKLHVNEKTVILITHKMSMLSLVDRVIIMDAGRVVADGSKESIISALKQGEIKVSL